MNNELKKLIEDIESVDDLYFLSLLVVSKLMKSKSHPKIMLGELCYLLDTQSFLNLILYFEGETIKVPTRNQLKKTLKLISLYYHHDICKLTWKDTFKKVGVPFNKENSRKYKRLYKTFEEELKDIKLPKSLKN